MVLAAAGCATAAVAAIYLVAWLQNFSAPFSILTAVQPMRWDTALAFLCYGLALVAASRNHRRWCALLTAAAGFIGAVTFAQYSFGSSSGGGLAGLLSPGQSDASSFPALFPGAGFGLVAAAAAFPLSRRPPADGLFGALLGGIVVAQGAAVLLLALSGMTQPAHVLRFAEMPLATAALFVLLGAVVIVIRPAARRDGAGAQWLPPAGAAALFAVTLIFWAAFQAEQTQVVSRLLRVQANALAGDIDRLLSAHRQALAALAADSTRGAVAQPEIVAAARQELRDHPEIRSIALVGDDGRAVWRVATAAAANADADATAVAVLAPGAPVAGAAVVHERGGKLLSLASPVAAAAGSARLVETLSLSQFLEGALRSGIEADETARIDDARGVLFDQGWTSGDVPESTAPVTAAGLDWRVRLQATPHLLSATRSWLPLGILLAGSAAATLLGVVLHLLISARQQRRVIAAREREVVRSEEKYRRLLEALDYGVFVVQDYRFVFANTALPALLGYSRDQFMQLGFADVIAPQSMAPWSDGLRERINTSMGTHFRYELCLLHKDRKQLVWVQMHTQRTVYNGAPAVLGIVCDISARRAAEEQANDYRERLELVARGAVDGIWDWDVVSGSCYFSERFHELLGYPAGTITPSLDGFLALVHPDDRDNVKAEAWRCARERLPYEGGFRLRHAAGHYLWVRSCGLGKWDAQGRPLRMAGSVADISERVAQREALRRSEQRFRLLVEGVKDYAIVILDCSGNVVTWNAGAQRSFGYEDHEVIGKGFQMFLTGDDIAAGKGAQELTAAVTHGRSEAEGWRIRKDGTRFWAHVVCSPLHDAEGQLVGFAKITRDLTQRKRDEEKLLTTLKELETIRRLLEKDVSERTSDLAVARDQLRRFAIELDRNVENERRRLARDVHDQLGQVFTGLKMTLRANAARLPEPFVTDTASMLESGIAVTRKISSELRPPLLDDLGLAMALNHLAEHSVAVHGVSVVVDVTDDDILTADQANQLYRIVQEALTNVLRHAQARWVRIDGAVDQGSYRLLIENDGVPFQADKVRASAQGVIGMRERAQLVGGRFDIAAGRDGGAIVTVRVPTGRLMERVL
jgi:PAS domain S-box-containing protein